jgi:3-oxoacyl-[acyl-carrier protein] reductase
MRQRVLIVGATGGIGRALAEGLHAEGAGLVLAARGATALEALGERLGAETLVTDATDIEAFGDAVGRVATSPAGEALTGIALCVGAILLKPAHRTRAAEWHEVIARNLTTAFAVTRAAGLHLGAGGSVVLVSSAAARIGLQNHEAIAASKAGIEGLVRSAAATYARKGLRFNAVAPGLVRTPLAGALASDPKMAEASAKMHPLGRIGEPEDVARAMAFLLAPAQSWVTGQVLGVDGGLADLKLPSA